MQARRDTCMSTREWECIRVKTKTDQAVQLNYKTSIKNTLTSEKLQYNLILKCINAVSTTYTEKKYFFNLFDFTNKFI